MDAVPATFPSPAWSRYLLTLRLVLRKGVLEDYRPPSALYRSLLASAKSFDLNLAADPNYSHVASREEERTFCIA